MAGTWLLAASVAVQILAVKADIEIGAPIAPELLTCPGYLHERQASSSLSAVGSLTSTLVPVATICASANTSDTASPPAADFATVSATATLPGGGSTVFATRIRRQAGQPEITTDALGVAHLVSGTDGCSTLFTPTTFSACSTVVSPIGLPLVTITECDQYVTFSSETLFMCPPTPSSNPCSYSASPDGAADPFTMRPFSQNDTFQNASTTYTPGADSNDVELAASVTSYSSASGMPMSLPRHLQRDKRQIMFDHTGRAIETDAATIAPGKHINPRQLMFDRTGGEFTTDLVVIAPSYTASTEAQTVSSSMPMRQMKMATRITGTDDLELANTEAIDVNAPVSTKLMSIPDLAKVKHRHKILHEDDAPLPNNMKRADLFDGPDFAYPIVLNTSSTNNTNSTKLAKLETIRLANAAHAAAVQNLSPPSPTKFYAAPWNEVLAGGVPEHVLGITCYGGAEHAGKCSQPDTDGDAEECECATERQSWVLSSITETRIGTTLVKWAGPLVITGPGGALTTTNINFTSRFDTTRSFVDSFVVKSTLSGEGTVTRTLTSVPSATISLVTGGDVKAAGPQEAPATLTSGADDVPTTLVLTSYVATETVTVPPAEESGDAMVPGAESTGDASVKRNDGDE